MSSRKVCVWGMGGVGDIEMRGRGRDCSDFITTQTNITIEVQRFFTGDIPKYLEGRIIHEKKK